MAKKYNKLEPKVPKEVTYSLLGFLVVVIVLFILLIPSKQEKFYALYSDVATDDFTEDHPFYELSYKKLIDKLENDEYVILFIGTPTSTTAYTYIGAFQKYYEQLEVSEYVDYIYYFDPTEDEDNFVELMDQYDDIAYSAEQLILFIDNEVSVQFTANGTSDTQLINRAAKKFFDDALEAMDAAGE
ncbi:MAG: hypothetical protein WCR19_03265 [Acholeplasmataceae bacterium]